LDGDRYSYWATEDDITEPELIIELNQVATFDLIPLRENIKLGQRLDSVWIPGRIKDGNRKVTSAF